MILCCNIFLTLIFLCISAIHIYWAFGGNYGKYSAIPTKKSGEILFNPSAVACFSVGLFFIFLIILINDRKYTLVSNERSTIVLIICAFVFLIRFVGDFKYLGISKKVKNTIFGKKDTRYYSSLCLLICLLIIVKLYLEYKF